MIDILGIIFSFTCAIFTQYLKIKCDPTFALVAIANHSKMILSVGELGYILISLLY